MTAIDPRTLRGDWNYPTRVRFGPGRLVELPEACRALGIARPPRAYPWQAHLRGLAGDLALGLATHVALSALETDFGRRPLKRHRGA